jgi:hypothetical protein
MESGDFPVIRLQFFGTFLVYPKRVKAILAKYVEDFQRAHIAPEIFFKRRKQLEKYLKKHDTEK